MSTETKLRGDEEIELDKARLLPYYLDGVTMRRMAQDTGLTLHQVRKTIERIQDDIGEIKPMIQNRALEASDDALMFLVRLFTQDEHGVYIEKFSPMQSTVVAQRIKAATEVLDRCGIVKPRDGEDALTTILGLRAAGVGRPKQDDPTHGEG